MTPPPTSSLAPLVVPHDGRTTIMHEVHAALPPVERQQLQWRATEALQRWEAAGGTADLHSSEADRDAVRTVAGVFSPDECERIVTAVREAAERRGGWDVDRHSVHRTTDMPLSEASGVEQLIREAVFARILRPHACVYCAHAVPEALMFRDCFFVRYSAQEPGAQTGLAVHADGSTFSFNVLLSPQDAFDGGGTFFERSGETVRPRRGEAVVHSGGVRHGGNAITRGERLLLVGFVGVEKAPYTSRLARWAGYHAFTKFGREAWRECSSERACRAAVVGGVGRI